MFAGLQDLGVANGEDLKETLTNCTEPLKAIEQFQVGPPLVVVLQGDAGTTQLGVYCGIRGAFRVPGFHRHHWDILGLGALPWT